LIVQVLVEGSGDELAVPELLRRLQGECGAFNLAFDHPIRRTRAALATEQGIRQAVRLALKKERGCEGMLIVFDSDRDCPKTLGRQVRKWVEIESPDLPAEVVIACREYEAWFLGALESLRGRRGIFGRTPSLTPGRKLCAAPRKGSKRAWFVAQST
jgi:hypothetical protein